MSSDGWKLTKEMRRTISAELVWEFIPKTQKDARPKATIFQQIVETWEQDHKDKKDDPFLETHSDFFISEKTLAFYWPDIKDILAQDGKFIAVVPGRHGGVYATRSTVAITRAFNAHQHIIKRSAERYNFRAELANKKARTQLPSMAVQLALPTNTT